MKFPVFFRVLAAFNIFGGLALLFLLIVMATVSGGLVDINPYLYSLFWFFALLMVGISFAWFFAASNAYGLLIINFIASLLVGVSISFMAWTRVADQHNAAIWIMLALIPIVYSLFNFFGIFYKPIREWAKANNPAGITKAHAGVFISAAVSLALFFSAGYLLQGYKPNKHEVVLCNLVYSGNETELTFRGYFPFDIAAGENINIPLMDTACIDAIQMTFTDTPPAALTTAHMIDGEGKEQTLSFVRDGEYLVASIQPICTKQITIFTQTRTDSAQYSIASIQLIRHFSLFQREPDDNVSVMPNDGDAEHFSAEEEFGDNTINKVTILDYGTQLLSILLLDDYWNFPEKITDDRGWLSPKGIRIGLYSHGLAGLRESAVQMLCESIGSEYTREACISSVFGRELFYTSPAASEYQDNVPYRKVNPQTIEWLANFIPDPTDELGLAGSPTVGKVYEESFQRLARLLTDSYFYIAYNGDREGWTAEYQDAMDDEEFHGPTWLNQKFEKTFQDKYSPEYTKGTFDTSLPPLLIGFWLRRNMDGSASTIWTVLSNFMKQYDNQWFEECNNSWQPEGE